MAYIMMLTHCWLLPSRMVLITSTVLAGSAYCAAVRLLGLKNLRLVCAALAAAQQPCADLYVHRPH